MDKTNQPLVAPATEAVTMSKEAEEVNKASRQAAPTTNSNAEEVTAEAEAKVVTDLKEVFPRKLLLLQAHDQVRHALLSPITLS